MTELLIATHEVQWREKSLPGVSEKMLWRNEESGASIALIRFAEGTGIPTAHSHASNQFMFTLSGEYKYLNSDLILTPNSFYMNSIGNIHGPTRAIKETIFLEIYDGPHYPTMPAWYTDPRDAK